MAAKLSINEKYIIQGRLSDGDSVKDIAKSLGRQAKTVQNYMDNELDSIHNTIAQVETDVLVDKIDKAVEESKQPKPKRKPKNTGFVNKTPGGADGIAVSTPAASAQSDYLREQYPKTVSRTVKGNIFKIDDQSVND
jgi:hypothetical protein